jgi:hypothetical protein
MGQPCEFQAEPVFVTFTDIKIFYALDAEQQLGPVSPWTLKSL